MKEVGTGEGRTNEDNGGSPAPCRITTTSSVLSQWEVGDLTKSARLPWRSLGSGREKEGRKKDKDGTARQAPQRVCLRNWGKFPIRKVIYQLALCLLEGLEGASHQKGRKPRGGGGRDAMGEQDLSDTVIARSAW